MQRSPKLLLFVLLCAALGAGAQESTDPNPSALFEQARALQRGDSGTPDLAAAGAIYRRIASLSGTPYVRRAQFELGNLVLDGKYTSGQPALDLFWARSIAQELLGQEEYRLAFANGSSMDLPASPEVNRLVVRSAASYNVDLAQRALAAHLPFPESAAWLRLSGGYFDQLAAQADDQDRQFNPEQRGSVAQEYVNLLQVRIRDGAFYRADDPLLDPGAGALEKLLRHGTDSDAQLRLAFYYETRSSEGTDHDKALDLYRTVRDQRVSSIRSKIGTLYLTGQRGFPRDLMRAGQWFSFAARAGSSEACHSLHMMQQDAMLSPEHMAPLLVSCKE